MKYKSWIIHILGIVIPFIFTVCATFFLKTKIDLYTVFTLIIAYQLLVVLTILFKSISCFIDSNPSSFEKIKSSAPSDETDKKTEDYIVSGPFELAYEKKGILIIGIITGIFSMMLTITAFLTADPYLQSIHGTPYSNIAYLLKVFGLSLDVGLAAMVIYMIYTLYFFIKLKFNKDL